MPDREKKLREERNQITNMIFDYCFSDAMKHKGCANCKLSHLDVCGDYLRNGTKIPMSLMREAEKIITDAINEVSA